MYVMCIYTFVGLNRRTTNDTFTALWGLSSEVVYETGMLINKYQ